MAGVTDDAQSPGFLAHEEGDHVAVAVRDLEPGPVQGGYLRGPSSVNMEVAESIPLGHKIALTDITAGQDVVEYGTRVAVATENISQGGYVHVHNIRSARWQNSIA